MNRIQFENLETYVLAGVGLVRGIGEAIIKPFLVEHTEKPRKIAAAAIHFYTTGDEDGR